MDIFSFSNITKVGVTAKCKELQNICLIYFQIHARKMRRQIYWKIEYLLMICCSVYSSYFELYSTSQQHNRKIILQVKASKIQCLLRCKINEECEEIAASEDNDICVLLGEKLEVEQHLSSKDVMSIYRNTQSILNIPINSVFLFCLSAFGNNFSLIIWKIFFSGTAIVIGKLLSEKGRINIVPLKVKIELMVQKLISVN